MHRRSQQRDLSLHAIQPAEHEPRLRTESQHFLRTHSGRHSEFQNLTFVEDELGRLSMAELQDQLATQIERNKLIQAEINQLRARPQPERPPSRTRDVKDK
jgi:hypothetical protein